MNEHRERRDGGSATRFGKKLGLDAYLVRRRSRAGTLSAPDVASCRNRVSPGERLQHTRTGAS